MAADWIVYDAHLLDIAFNNAFHVLAVLQFCLRRSAADRNIHDACLLYASLLDCYSIANIQDTHLTSSK